MRCIHDFFKYGLTALQSAVAQKTDPHLQKKSYNLPSAPEKSSNPALKRDHLHQVFQNKAPSVQGDPNGNHATMGDGTQEYEGGYYKGELRVETPSYYRGHLHKTLGSGSPTLGKLSLNL